MLLVKAHETVENLPIEVTETGTRLLETGD